jgi:hypothetical protein
VLEERMASTASMGRLKKRHRIGYHCQNCRKPPAMR